MKNIFRTFIMCGLLGIPTTQATFSSKIKNIETAIETVTASKKFKISSSIGAAITILGGVEVYRSFVHTSPTLCKVLTIPISISIAYLAYQGTRFACRKLFTKAIPSKPLEEDENLVVLPAPMTAKEIKKIFNDLMKARVAEGDAEGALYRLEGMLARTSVQNAQNIRKQKEAAEKTFDKAIKERQRLEALYTKITTQQNS